MRVYSWKTLIVTILIGGIGFTHQLKKLIQGDRFAFLYVLFWAYLIAQGLWVSFSKEGYQKDMRNETIRIKLMNRFGKWAPIVTYGEFIIFFIALIIGKVLPILAWLSYILFFAGIIFMLIKGLYIRKYVIEKMKKYF